MTFVSVEFAILLAASFLAFWLSPHRVRPLLLLTASYIFYCYWNPWYAVLILVSTAIDYCAGLVLARESRTSWRKAALWTSIAANLGLLGYFKYTNFTLSTLHTLLGPLASPLPNALDILLPVGISFYTFQSMSYTIDVYRRTIEPERNFFSFALFIAYFPQLVAGPIERTAHLLPQLKRSIAWNPANFESGIRLLLLGLFKKLVLADRLSLVVGPMIQHPNNHSAGDLAVAGLGLFTMLYFDFSAYVDMARGSSQLFGVRLSENFRFPMAATSPADFWRRWHITLGTWIRDYVFIPLGGYRSHNSWIRFRTVVITMGLVGLWHGAQWTFVLWGLGHGVVLALQIQWQLTLKKSISATHWLKSPAAACAGWTFLTTIHVFSMLLFFSPSLGQAFSAMGRVLSPGDWQMALHPATLPVLGIFFIATSTHVLGRHWNGPQTIEHLPAPARAALTLALFIALLALALERSTPFVYFQF